MPHSRKASNSSLTKSGKLAPVSVSTCAKKLSRCSKDHLIQRRFFGAPVFVVDLVSSRRERNRLAHDLFLLLFCITGVIYSIMVSPWRVGAKLSITCRSYDPASIFCSSCSPCYFNTAGLNSPRSRRTGTELRRNGTRMACDPHRRRDSTAGLAHLQTNRPGRGSARRSPPRAAAG